MYNESNFIERTLKSLADQTKHDLFKVIIVDNASTDGSLDIVKNFIKGAPSMRGNVQIIANKSNYGASSSFRQCFEESKDKYFMWLGAHDYLFPSFVEETLPLISNDDTCAMASGIPCGIGLSGNFEVNKVYEITSASYDFSQDNPFARYIKSVVELSNCTIFHSIFKKQSLVGYEFSGVPSEDHIIISRLLWSGRLKFSRTAYVRQYFPEKIKNQKIQAGAYTKNAKFFNQYLRDFEKLATKKFDQPLISELRSLVFGKLVRRFGLPIE